MTQFSDNGITFHGAYGHRWKNHFSYDKEATIDQVSTIANRLKTNHDDRRQVLQIWDCSVDLTDQANKRDIPCNLVVHFQIVNGALDMTVFNRSNDIVWGTYGANAVHFSMLQEFIAVAAGVDVGRYWQISDNWHGYRATVDPLFPLAEQRCMPPDVGPVNPYAAFEPFPMINTDIDTWQDDLRMFLDEEGRAMGYKDRFFRRVALPMMAVHNTYKDMANPNRFLQALNLAQQIKAEDWRKAVEEWIIRRNQSYQEKKFGLSKPLA